MTIEKEFPGGQVWHGEDEAAKRAAIKRAKEIGGYAIRSSGPKTDSGDAPGYWSDPSGFLRNWETQIWPK